jgi:GxxExxY protein
LALKCEDLTSKVIGAFYDVYNELGHGFLESVYHKAMIVALRTAGLEVATEVAVPVTFRGQSVGEFRADLVVNQTILVELKVAQALDRTHYAQVMNYLKATPFEIALLFNFGAKPAFKRIIFDNPSKEIRLNPCESVVRV